MTFKLAILSIDGGGIRGIVPAIILAEIEKRTEIILSAMVENTENARICKLFDLIVGTSTGGILTLGLTKPNGRNAPEFKSKDLVQMYADRGKGIFQERRGIEGIISPYFRTKFTSKARKDVLNKYLGETLIEKALTEIFITSYETELRKPIFFTSNSSKEKNDEEFEIRCKGYKMIDVAMGTSAAPTYFKPHSFKHSKNGDVTLIDGGVFANNPTAIAVLEIINSYYSSSYYKSKQEKISLNEILVVSIGTGKHSRSFTFNELKNMGQFQWVKEPLIQIIFDSQSEFLSYQIAKTFPNFEMNVQSKPCYYRLQANYGKSQEYSYSGRRRDDFKNVSPSMDNISEKNIFNLKKVAEEFIEIRGNDLDYLCQTLVDSLLNTRVFLKRGE